MANNNNFRVDRFGNQFTVVGCKDKKASGYPKGYVEIAGQLYRLEPSRANKEGVDMWIRVTKMQKRSSGSRF